MTNLDTIGEMFPEPHWMYVYTDDFGTETNSNTNAGVYFKHFNLSRAFGTYCTNFGG